MLSRRVKGWLCAGALAVGSLGMVAGAFALSPTANMTATRRLTETQYRHSIADIFGPDIAINGRFEPERREDLLLAIGASKLSISGAGFDQYFNMAKTISDQVFDDKHRAKVTTCQPADAKKTDAKCVEQFLRTYGEKLFRRPLADSELKPRIALAVKTGDAAGNHYVGMKQALISLLVAPQYLFRVETAEGPAGKTRRLDPYSRAARLSFLLWDTTPDDELLRAAGAGELNKPDGLKKQVDRLLASPKVEDGTRAYFADMLQFDYFDTVTKDAAVYPKFSAALMNSAREQTLKTLVDLLLAKNGDYRDIFTTRDTFIDRQLASVYQAPFIATGGWTRYTVPNDKESAGLITQVTFLSLFSHPGRSSPTKRGVALNEIFLCQPTPTPPANVDFSLVNNTNNPDLKTVRDRLLAHALDDECAGCHNRSDPIGLSLEHFDSLGQRREAENGAKIDVTAALDGKKFTGATGLGQLLHDNPRVPECLVRDVYAYGVGAAPGADDAKYLAAQSAAFAQDGYRLKSLLARIAVSDDFYKAVTPAPDKPAKVDVKVAQAPQAKTQGAQR